jgi:hypothetical protein
LNDVPFSKLVSTIIFDLRAANGSSTEESFHAAPAPCAVGFQSSAAPFGR